MKLSIPVLILAAASCLPGCHSVSIPAASVGPLSNPAWTWTPERPRDRVRAEVRFRFPPCKFSTPDEQEQLDELLREINTIGDQLNPALERDQLTPDEYVASCFLLEYVTVQLLAACEQVPAPVSERVKAMLEESPAIAADVAAIASARGRDQLTKAGAILEKIRQRLN